MVLLHSVPGCQLCREPGHPKVLSRSFPAGKVVLQRLPQPPFPLLLLMAPSRKEPPPPAAAAHVAAGAGRGLPQAALVGQGLGCVATLATSGCQPWGCCHGQRARPRDRCLMVPHGLRSSRALGEQEPLLTLPGQWGAGGCGHPLRALPPHCHRAGQSHGWGKGITSQPRSCPPAQGGSEQGGGPARPCCRRWLRHPGAGRGDPLGSLRGCWKSSPPPPKASSITGGLGVPSPAA